MTTKRKTAATTTTGYPVVMHCTLLHGVDPDEHERVLYDRDCLRDRVGELEAVVAHQDERLAARRGAR